MLFFKYFLLILLQCIYPSDQRQTEWQRIQEKPTEEKPVVVLVMRGNSPLSFSADTFGPPCRQGTKGCVLSNQDTFYHEDIFSVYF